jgi:hypothetical protein
MTAQPKFKIKVPQTFDQAAKLRKWLEQIQHKTQRPELSFISNLIYQIKGAKTQADIDRLQPFMAYQAEKLAEAPRLTSASTNSADPTCSNGRMDRGIGCAEHAISTPHLSNRRLQVSDR